MQFTSLEAIHSYILQYQTASFIVYLILQVFQIIVSVIPGQALQFAIGYTYGFTIGYILSIIGAVIGTTIAFYLARILGRDAIHLVFDEKKVTRVIEMLNSKRGFIILFLIFLIPGLPKDITSYAAGVSDIRFRSFIIISAVGRSPAMIGSIMIGIMYYSGSYLGMAIIIAMAVLLFILGIIYRNRLMDVSDKVYGFLIKDSKKNK